MKRALWLGSLCALLPISTLTFQQDSVSVLDPLAVAAQGDPGRAVATITLPPSPPTLDCDLVIAGGGLGGVAAALTAAKAELRVCMTEPTRWIGGQITAQGVSALDENKWIETTGATASYQELRKRIRDHYKPYLKERQHSPAALNPGSCWVSGLCFEPAVGLDVLKSMTAPSEQLHKLVILLRTVPVRVSKTGTRITHLLGYNFETHNFVQLNGKVFIDATELGDLLPLAGARFRVGADARADTGEPDAAGKADASALQSFTYPFVLSSKSSSSVLVSRQTDYAETSKTFGLGVGDEHGQHTQFGFYKAIKGTAGSFWTYRRLIDANQFLPSAYPTDISMINWDSNDVCDSNYLASKPLAQAQALQHGKRVSLAFAWWLQHDAPHDGGGGKGFSDLSLRNDLLGTSDGLSQFPYIREGRRMVALRTIREQDVAEPWQAGARAEIFEDTAGIGYYPIDIHACGAPQRLPKSKPYQISAASLISANVSNLLAGGKNIGTTHIVNGGYRLQPTEWAIGEASGALAIAAIKAGLEVTAIQREPSRLLALQERLLRSGHPLIWFDDVPVDDPSFAAIQLVTLKHILSADPASLHFRPHAQVSDVEASTALKQLQGQTSLSSRGMDSLKMNEGHATRAEFAVWIASHLPPVH